jgi:hypothetical protein
MYSKLIETYIRDLDERYTVLWLNIKGVAKGSIAPTERDRKWTISVTKAIKFKIFPYRVKKSTFFS